MNLYVIPMSVVCARVSSVCHSYVLVCHPNVTHMYPYVIRMSLVCTRMSSVCHLYVLVCHLYATQYVTCMWFYHDPIICAPLHKKLRLRPVYCIAREFEL